MMDVNFLGILVCAVAAMILGYLWYGPMLFGKRWMKEAKVSEAQNKKANMTGMYILMFVSALVEAYVLSVIISVFSATTLMAGFTGAFWIWLGFIATTMIGMVTAEGRSWTYYGIVAGYQLVVLLVMSAILVTL